MIQHNIKRHNHMIQYYVINIWYDTVKFRMTAYDVIRYNTIYDTIQSSLSYFMNIVNAGLTCNRVLFNLIINYFSYEKDLNISSTILQICT